MPPEQTLRTLYRRDPATGAFLIEIALDVYESIFNEWDPAPFKRRDLDPDLRVYLEDCADEIPLDHEVALQFTVPADVVDAQKQARVQEGLANGLAWQAHSLSRRLKRLYRRSAAFGLIAMGLLVLSVLARRLGPALAWQVLQEGLTIGAWVLAWETVSWFAFERTRVGRRTERWRRYQRAPVHFVSVDRKNASSRT